MSLFFWLHPQDSPSAGPQNPLLLKSFTELYLKYTPVSPTIPVSSRFLVDHTSIKTSSRVFQVFYTHRLTTAFSALLAGSSANSEQLGRRGTCVPELFAGGRRISRLCQGFARTIAGDGLFSVSVNSSTKIAAFKTEKMSFLHPGWFSWISYGL